MAVVRFSWKAFGDRPWTAQMEKKLRMVRQLRPPGKMVLVLCAVCFAAALLLNGGAWGDHMRRRQNPTAAGSAGRSSGTSVVPAGGADCDLIKRRLVSEQDAPVIGDLMGEVARTHKAVQSLEKTISSLEMELSVARTTTSPGSRSPSNGGASGKSAKRGPTKKKKALMVVGINTAFSSRKRRDSLRETWVPRGPKLKRLEEEKGVVVRFVIGRSPTPGGALDRAIDAEAAETEDFLRLRDHVEAYHELSAKTRLYFAAAAAAWDADFYVKVDDDVHLNIGMLAATLARHRTKPRVYIGCMKSGPVLSQKGLKYHEPEFMKFGDEGNNYFMHATGQIYAVSKDLAAYISINAPILHRYANEDVSMGAWLIGLEVEHVDDRTMCCGTPPDCELKTEAGNVCVATFDWSCSGICRSVDRMKDVHDACGEGDEAIWTVHL